MLACAAAAVLSSDFALRYNGTDQVNQQVTFDV
jgi:hypothetical protein